MMVWVPVPILVRPPLPVMKPARVFEVLSRPVVRVPAPRRISAVPEVPPSGAAKKAKGRQRTEAAGARA